MKIIIQGAMQNEIADYLNFFSNCQLQVIDNYKFYVGKHKENDIIISITEIGVVNATISTMIAINHFSPDLVINQGTCGGHTLDMNIGDVIAVKKAVNINNFKTPLKRKGQGSNALLWKPMSCCVKEEECSQQLLKLFEHKFANSIKVGTIGTADMFSRETDRIETLHNLFGHLAEDMETLPVYKVCQNFKIPCLGVRVVSNNELKPDFGSLNKTSIGV